MGNRAGACAPSQLVTRIRGNHAGACSPSHQVRLLQTLSGHDPEEAPAFRKGRRSAHALAAQSAGAQHEDPLESTDASLQGSIAQSTGAPSRESSMILAAELDRSNGAARAPAAWSRDLYRSAFRHVGTEHLASIYDRFGHRSIEAREPGSSSNRGVDFRQVQSLPLARGRLQQCRKARFAQGRARTTATLKTDFLVAMEALLKSNSLASDRQDAEASMAGHAHASDQTVWSRDLYRTAFRHVGTEHLASVYDRFDQRSIEMRADPVFSSDRGVDIHKAASFTVAQACSQQGWRRMIATVDDPADPHSESLKGNSHGSDGRDVVDLEVAMLSEITTRGSLAPCELQLTTTAQTQNFDVNMVDVADTLVQQALGMLHARDSVAYDALSHDDEEV